LSAASGRVLVVDDDVIGLKLLARAVEQQGHTVATAMDGGSALARLVAEPFDLVLLDIVMPGMDGFDVLAAIKADDRLRHLPVIAVSANDDLGSAVRCIELGAEDYLAKPFDPVLLRARVSAGLARKHLHDVEQEYLRLLHIEQERSERLILDVLPAPIAARLKSGERVIADAIEDATVLFADIQGFTSTSAGLAPTVLVDRLNGVFSAFDALVERHGVEKIKTIGDAYMAVGGAPVARADHAEAMLCLAFDMLDTVRSTAWIGDTPMQVRIGVATGPVVAGVIGVTRFVYDLWGDTVNTASRMESHGIPGMVQMTPGTAARVRDRFPVSSRGVVEIKGKGAMETYLAVRG
jgi:adenylate cyclase